MPERLELIRREDWPERLAASISRQAQRHFKWGRHDCTTAWADNCKAMTGVDPMAEFRGQYQDEESAKEALERIGSNSLFHTMTAKFGRAVPVARARRGDPVLARIDGRPTLLTCIGAEAIGPGVDGPVRVPMVSARAAWMVG